MQGSARGVGLALLALAGLAAVAWVLARGSGSAPVRPEGLAPEVAADGGGDELPDVARAGDRSAVDAAPATADDAPAAPAAAEEGPAREGSICGRVVDDHGVGIAGARVAARFLATREFSMLDLELKHTEREIARGDTDAEGRFALEVPAAHPLDLEARRAGFGTARRRGCYAGEEVEIVLRRGATFAGRVVRADDGRPVAGVPLRGWSPDDRAERFRGESGPDGSFRFEDLIPGPLRYEVEPTDLAAPEWITVELEAGEVLERTIELESGIAVHGRVTDAATGAPVAGAEVWEGWFGRKRVRAQADGSYRLAGFGGPGVYEVHVHADGYGNVAHEFSYPDLPREDVELDFELPPARRARGRVVDRSGAPVVDAYVAAVHSSYPGAEQITDWEPARTDAAGHYALPSLHPELRHTLFVRKQGFGTVLYDFPLAEMEVPEIVLPDVVLPPPARLEGRVLDEEGAPRAGMRVDLEGWNDDFQAFAAEGASPMQQGLLDGYVGTREVKSDSLGRFSFADLAAGRYALRVRAPGGAGDVRQTVEVAEAAWVRDVEVVLPRGLSIRGRVLAPDGHGLTEVIVRARGEENGLESRATTGAGGAFELGGLGAGRYSLVADPVFVEEGDEGPGYADVELRGVEAGAEPVDITLPRAARVEGVVLGADGQPFPRAFVFAHADGERQVGWDIADEVGAFSMEVEPDVPLRFSASPTTPSDSSPFGVDSVGGREDQASVEGVRAPAVGVTLRLPSHSG